ncbi:MAG TPA: hypothetical protein VIG57_11320, partial [Candidatus Entotheonella sp.]
LALYFGSREVMTLATHKKLAMEIANNEMEAVKEGGYAALPVPANNWVATGAVTLGDFTVQTRRRISNVNVGTFINRQVEVEVRWREGGKNEDRTITLVNHFANVPGY